MSRRFKRFVATLAATISLLAIATQASQAYEARYYSYQQTSGNSMSAQECMSTPGCTRVGDGFRPMGGQQSGIQIGQYQQQQSYRQSERRINRYQETQIPRVQISDQTQQYQGQQQSTQDIFQSLERQRTGGGRVQRSYQSGNYSNQYQNPVPPINLNRQTQSQSQYTDGGSSDIPIYGGSPEVRNSVKLDLQAMSPELKRHVKGVRINDGLNPQSSRASASASGPEGIVDVWKGGRTTCTRYGDVTTGTGRYDCSDGSTFDHEAAHLAAFNKNGGSSYDPSGEYKRIMQQNGPVSSYGAEAGPVEDWAETIELYKSGKLKDPDRIAYVERWLQQGG